MEKIDTLFQKMRISGQKNGPFFSKSRTCRLYKNRPFLSEIQNDDAYLLTTGVAGPGVPLMLPIFLGGLIVESQKQSLVNLSDMLISC